MNQETGSTQKWLHFVRTVSGLAVGLVVVITSALLGIWGAERDLLGADILASSRGGNTSNVLTILPQCNSFNNYACTTSGADCSACNQTNYTYTTPGSNGGYSLEGQSWGCGESFNGICDVNLACGTYGNSTGKCSAPKVIVQSP